MGMRVLPRVWGKRGRWLRKYEGVSVDALCDVQEGR